MPEIWDPQIPADSAKDGTDYILVGNSVDGARRALVGQAGGPVIYDAQGNIISSGSGSFKLSSGADVTGRGSNRFFEPSGEYSQLYWNNVTGSISTNFDTRIGGPHHFSTAAFEAFTSGSLYNVESDKNYYILFEDLGVVRFEYKVELLDADNQTLLATLVDWTASKAGINIIDLANDGVWPASSPTGWSFIRFSVRSLVSGSFRFASVSLSYGTPYYPSRDRANEIYHNYRYGDYLTGTGYKTDTAIAAGTTVWLVRNAFYVPQGWRLRVGTVRYYAALSDMRLVVYASYGGTTFSWTSSVNKWYGVLNMTVVPTQSAPQEAWVYLGFKNISSSSVNLYKQDDILARIQAVPL